MSDAGCYDTSCIGWIDFSFECWDPGPGSSIFRNLGGRLVRIVWVERGGKTAPSPFIPPCRGCVMHAAMHCMSTCHMHGAPIGIGRKTKIHYLDSINTKQHFFTTKKKQNGVKADYHGSLHWQLLQESHGMPIIFCPSYLPLHITYLSTSAKFRLL